MKQIFLFVLLHSVHHCRVTAVELKNDPILLVEEVIHRFDKITDNSSDPIEKFEIIKETAADFVKLALPLETLVADSLNIAGKKESKEYKALLKLSNQVNLYLNRLKEPLDYSFNSENVDEDLLKFQTFITVHLNVLSKKVLRFMDPTKYNDSDSIKDLLLYCNGANGVQKMAEFINLRVQDKCHLDNTLVFVKIEKIFDPLEEQFSITEWEYHESLVMRRISEILFSNPSHQVLSELERIEDNLDTFSTLTSAIDGIYESIKHIRHQNPSTCFTDSVFSGSMYNRRKISAYASMIQTELTRLLISAPICGQFTHPNNRTKLEEYLSDVLTTIKNSSDFLAQYIPQKLNMSCGVEGLIVHQVIKHFGDREGDIPHKKYSELSNRIKEALKNIGPERIEKQIIVAPSKNADSQFATFYICPTYWCRTVLDQRGVDVMIARFERDQNFSTGFLEKHRDTVQTPIVDQLKKDYYNPLSRLVDKLERKKNVTLTTGWARSAAIIRHKTMCSVSCSYPTVLQEYRQESTDISGTTMFKHTNFRDKGWFDDNTCYHFFFFL